MKRAGDKYGAVDRGLGLYSSAFTQGAPEPPSKVIYGLQIEGVPALPTPCKSQIKGNYLWGG